MRAISIFATLVLLCMAPYAEAGAWLKKKGEAFSSVTAGANAHDELTWSYYFEYGLTDRMTVGIDASAFTNQADFRNGYGAVFIRRSLWDRDGPHKFAYELGFGALYRDDTPLPTVKAGLSWGRGFTLGERNGWMNVDASYLYEVTLGQQIAKIDGTLGLDLGDRVTGMFEVHFLRDDAQTSGSLEPSLLYRPKRGNFSFKLGAEIPHEDTSKAALKLGLWHRF